MDIILINPIPWNVSTYNRIHHFAELLSKDNRVLFINFPNVHFDREKERSKHIPNLEIWHNPYEFERNPFNRLKKGAGIEAKINSRFVKILQRLKIPKFFNFMKSAHQSKTQDVQKAYVRKFNEYSTSDEKFVLYQYPILVEYVPYFKKKGFKIIYDSVDDISYFDNPRTQILAKEEYLMKNSYFVLATGKTLLERALKFNKNSYYLTNGVESFHFIKSRQKWDKPNDLPSGKPIIGFFGLIAEHLDPKLLDYIITKRPQYDFVFIGNVDPVFSKYIKDIKSKNKNFHLLGARKYEELPQYLHFFNVTIIPFISLKQVTEAAHPVKIYESLAAGKPVVSIYLREMEKFPYVYLSKNYDEFLKNLDESLSVKMNLEEVDNFLEQNTWEARINQLKSYLK
ncbi:MAG: glycosyltransferase [Candidatus Helarchaeota archaeon]